MNRNVTVEQVKAVWSESDMRYPGSDFDVEIDYSDPNEVRITASQMYEHLPLSFAHLMKLSELFDTKNINEDKYSSEGCETCDYGSNYSLNFTIKPEGVKQ